MVADQQNGLESESQAGPGNTAKEGGDGFRAAGRVLRRLTETAAGLARGGGTTLKEFFRPTVTERYPDVRPELPPGSRGIPVLTLDEEGNLKCTACALCARACPTAVIEVEPATGPDGKKLKTPVFYNLDFSRCLQCNLCVEACPFDALEMSEAYELAEEEPERLCYDLDRLVDLWKKYKSLRVAPELRRARPQRPKART